MIIFMMIVVVDGVDGKKWIIDVGKNIENINIK